MSPGQRDGEHRLTWLDWRDRCEGNVRTDEVFPLLFAMGSMAGLTFGVIRPLTLPCTTPGPSTCLTNSGSTGLLTRRCRP